VSSLSLLTPWRQAVVAFLEEAFPEAEVTSGPRSGVSRDLDRISVFWPIWKEDANPNYARPTLIVRFWPARSKQPVENPDDPTALEQAADELLAAFETVQKPGQLVDGLYCRLVDVTPDYDPNEWGLEGTLAAWTLNPATLT